MATHVLGLATQGSLYLLLQIIPEGRDQAAASVFSLHLAEIWAHYGGFTNILPDCSIHPSFFPSILKHSLCNVLPPQLTAQKAQLRGEDKAQNQRLRAPSGGAGASSPVSFPEASGACQSLSGEVALCKGSHRTLGLSSNVAIHRIRKLSKLLFCY